MIQKNDVFYGKILLFGEYGVIYNSMALTIPYTLFKGELSFISRYKYTDSELAEESNKSLKEYAQHLKEMQNNSVLNCSLNVNQLQKDIDKGMYFESSIPQGYGVGSSGALVAAIYNRYAEEKIKSDRHLSNKSIFKLKENFSQMEAYFHGKSSGLDPLNCYIQYPLLINNSSDQSNEKQISTVAIPRNKFNKNGAIFLINSGKPGKTAPLVKHFLEECKDPSYKKMIDEEFIPTNNRCIKSLLNGQGPSFFQALKQLSKLEFQHFKHMIPSSIQEAWQRGMQTEDFDLKLCGSGGGGFMLGFAQDFNTARESLKQFGLEIIPVYRNS
ncbi:MAG: mevalonate kinase [Bacteroidetes bacterium 4572_77]|nr:MAG: mevalonate kinase [Bacteroidetes bacterium 4572_77]